MRRLIALAAVLIAPTTAVAAPDAGQDRARLVVLTDIGNEPDDAESLVRLLLYANDINIEALVATTSTHQRDRIRPDLIEERVRAYGAVLPNLRVHAGGWPDAAALASRIRRGAPGYGMANVAGGAMSEGARAIAAAADAPDPRPLWIAIWGGAADLAQALAHVAATRTPAATAAFVARLRVYSISDQDDAGPWVRAQFPDLFWIASIHGFGQYPQATWNGISAAVAGADPEPVSKRWLARNIRAHGPLGALYPEWIYIMEGDTPSFLNLIGNGLSDPAHPDWGGWGGRYTPVSSASGLWSDARDRVAGADGTMMESNHATIWRWRAAYQNDFAARIRWSVTPDRARANHAPDLILNGSAGRAPVTIPACPGRTVALSAAGSRDPDGPAPTYRWWWYPEAGGMHPPTLRMGQEYGETTEATIPSLPSAATPSGAPWRFHVILEARDDGTPAMTAYRRAVLEVPATGC